MSRFLSLVLISSALAACGGGGDDSYEACKAYIEAANPCIADNGGTELDAAATCDAYKGVVTTAATDYFNCLADVYDSIDDCSDTTEYSEKIADLSTCTL